jgi:hypothetical protein
MQAKQLSPAPLLVGEAEQVAWQAGTGLAPPPGGAVERAGFLPTFTSRALVPRLLPHTILWFPGSCLGTPCLRGSASLVRILCRDCRLPFALARTRRSGSLQGRMGGDASRWRPTLRRGRDCSHGRRRRMRTLGISHRPHARTLATASRMVAVYGLHSSGALYCQRGASF